jgi:ribosomal protein L31E
MAKDTAQTTTRTTTMTINLRKKLLRLHAARRRKRAAGLVTEAVARFTKSNPDGIRLSRELNEFIVRNSRGASSLWSKLKISVEKTGDRTEIKMYSAKAPAQAALPSAKAGEKKQTAKEAGKPEPQKQA